MLFGILGGLVLWCSHPAVFVLAGIGVILGFSYFQKKEWGKFAGLSIMYSMWGISFLLIYVVSFRHLQSDDYLQKFWAGAFISFPPSSFADLAWFPKFIVEFTGYAFGFSQAIFSWILSHSIFRLVELGLNFIKSPEIPLSIENIGILCFGITWMFLYLIATFVVVTGGFFLFLKNKKKFFLLILPAGFTLLAAILHKFPMVQRVLLFLIPPVIILGVKGIARFKDMTRRHHTLGLWEGLVAILFVYPLLSAGYHLVSPRSDQEFRPVIQYVNEHRHESDTLYGYYGAQGVFKYYAQRMNIPENTYIVGISSRNNWQNYIQDLNQLRGKDRVWLLFSHVFGYEELFFLEYLDSIGGKRLDMFKGTRASAYLYDLSLTKQ
jgi:hypothetical protein